MLALEGRRERQMDGIAKAKERGVRFGRKRELTPEIAAEIRAMREDSTVPSPRLWEANNKGRRPEADAPKEYPNKSGETPSLYTASSQPWPSWHSPRSHRCPSC